MQEQHRDDSPVKLRRRKVSDSLLMTQTVGAEIAQRRGHPGSLSWHDLIREVQGDSGWEVLQEKNVWLKKYQRMGEKLLCLAQ